MSVDIEEAWASIDMPDERRADLSMALAATRAERRELSKLASSMTTHASASCLGFPARSLVVADLARETYKILGEGDVHRKIAFAQRMTQMYFDMEYLLSHNPDMDVHVAAFIAATTSTTDVEQKKHHEH